MKLGKFLVGHQYKQYKTEVCAKLNVASGRGDDKAMRWARETEKEVRIES